MEIPAEKHSLTAQAPPLRTVGEHSNEVTPTRTVMAFATNGAGSNDERRLSELLSKVGIELFPFKRDFKFQTFLRLLAEIRRRRPDLVVMEGTGIGGGLALILTRLLFGTRYVVSSGDAVGPFLAASWPAFWPLFQAYERALYRLSRGFIGWTPYLVGRALTFGAPRGATAAGWAPFECTKESLREMRARLRSDLSIPEHALVVGIAGSLVWNKRYQYCYGWELLKALEIVERRDLRVLIVGTGSGLEQLKRLVGKHDPCRVVFSGQVAPAEVWKYLAAMDLASLPQSVDQVGSFRYTTKLSEYLAAQVPVVTGQIPMAYDLSGGWLWRLPGRAPWDPKYVGSLAALLSTLSFDDIALRQSRIPPASATFNRGDQVARVCDFLNEIIMEIDLTARGESR